MPSVNLTKSQKALRQSIDAAGENGIVLQPSADLEALINAQLIQNKKLDDGTVQARSAKYDSEAKPNGSVAVMESESSFAIEADIPMAPAQRGGRKEEQYPFSKLEVGQSFVVPATEQYPKPWETFASTVSSATRRHAVKSTTKTRKNRKGEDVPVLEATKKFTLRKVTAGDKYPNGKTEAVTGARVFRIA